MAAHGALIRAVSAPTATTWRRAEGGNRGRADLRAAPCRGAAAARDHTARRRRQWQDHRARGALPAHAECGSVSYTMGKNERLVISLPKGAYFAYAWITYSNGNTGNASGNLVNRIGEDDLLRVVIQKEVIVAP